MRLFISYSHKDRRFVYALIKALETFNIDVWLDEHEINIGDFLSSRIISAINEVEYVVVVISPNSINSQWVNFELSLILQRELKEGKIRLLPLLLQGDTVPAIIANRMFADFRTTKSSNKHFSNILRILGVGQTTTTLIQTWNETDDLNKHQIKEDDLNQRLTIVSDSRLCPKCHSTEKYETKEGYRVCADCYFQIFPNLSISEEWLCPLCGGYQRVGSDGGFGYCMDCGSQLFPDFIETNVKGWQELIKLKLHEKTKRM